VRLWSIHPKYLDSKGLVALWREGLLAKAVLEGRTKGYKDHPQLDRFKKRLLKSPKDNCSMNLIDYYLMGIFFEADRRNYKFDFSKISLCYEELICKPKNIIVTEGQLQYEVNHLLKKLKNRDPEKYKKAKTEITLYGIEPHPIFDIKKGSVEPWEKVK